MVLCPRWSRPIIISAIALALYLGMVDPTICANAEEDQDNLKFWLTEAAAGHSFAALEPPGSKGSLGLSAGMGVSEHRVSNENPLFKDDNLLNQDRNLRLSRAWLNHGTPWPLDLGLSLAYAPSSIGNWVGFYSQGTLFEKLALPAASLRIGFGRFFGVEGVFLESASLEAGISQGFLKIFTAYFNTGLKIFRGEMAPHENKNIAFAITEKKPEEGFKILENDQESKHYQWTEVEAALGLRILAFPPFFQLTTEGILAGSQRGAIAIKVSIGT